MAGLSLDLAAVRDGVARAYPGLAGPAEEFLSVWAAGIEDSCHPGQAWNWSKLTGDGFPLEVVFAFGERSLRLTADVAGPRTPIGEKLARAGGGLAELRVMQAGAELKFGAWIGRRWDERGASSSKIYAEVPAGRAPKELEPVLTTRAPALRILAYRPSDESWERYYRIERLAVWEVERIADRAGLPGRGAELVEQIGAVLDRRIDEVLPGLQHGFSVAGNGALTLFLFARVLGGDARIRRRILELARRSGWDAELYEHLSWGSAGRDDARTDHGMLSFAIAPGSAPRLSIGLRVRAGR
jgi:hypothetical protein